jgi:hypothetical protein
MPNGDHFLGLKFLLDRFPNARAFATASVVATMQNQIKPDFIRSFWGPRFPGQVPSQLLVPEVLDGDALSLEGEELNVVELGHTDTQHTTALHVPYRGMPFITTRTSISRSAMKRPGSKREPGEYITVAGPLREDADIASKPR